VQTQNADSACHTIFDMVDLI